MSTDTTWAEQFRRWRKDGMPTETYCECGYAIDPKTRACGRCFKSEATAAALDETQTPEPSQETP